MLITDGRRLSGNQYDCVIVGSGPAGLTVALELGASNRRVLILETDDGGKDCAPSIAYGHYAGGYWNGHAIRALGGTSAVWSGWCTTLRDEDFNNPAVGVSWPITREDLLPHYRASASVLDRHPSIVDYEKSLSPTWVYRPFSVKTPTRLREKYADVLRQSASIHVALGCTAVGVDANDARTAVSRLRYFRHDSGDERVLSLRSDQALVIAGGGIGNAQLLLQPREDGNVPVGNESGLVGRFLMEHPHFPSSAHCIIDENLHRHRPPVEFGRFLPTIVMAAPRARELGRYGCSLEFSVNDEYQDVRTYLETTTGAAQYVYRLDLRAEMRPSAHNRVVLSAERDRTSLHRPLAHCVLAADDFMNAEFTLREFGHMLIRENRGRLRIDNDLIYRRVLGGGHIMGTTRMGTDRSNSVVDRNCRVHGYRNFFLAGSSVFATGGYANPTFTIVALASRLAHEILGG
jgi:choline dehydrogenase-like flavoprotein